jgi:Ca2+-binding RTX toxin-like protein
MANIFGTDKNDNITLASGTATTNLVGLAGNDKLTSLSGDTNLYGDVLDNIVLNFTSLSSAHSTVYDDTPHGSNAGAFAQIPVFWNDTLTAYSGNNLLVGDATNFSINVHGTDSLAAGVSAPVIVTNVNVSFGNDTLYDPDGNNTMYGDLETFSVSVIAGSGGGAGSEATARIGVLAGNVHNVNTGQGTPGLLAAFGNDTITTGAGADLIYGDAKNFLITLLSGSNSVGATARARLDESKFTFGVDKISSGDGNDVVFGDVQNFNMTLTTGDNASNNRAQDVSSYIFGNDVIQSGNGNDFIYGDAQHLNWTFTVGSGLDGTNASPLPGGFARWGAGSLSYGNDNITAGNGDNWIYGDIQDWTITASGGAGVHGKNASEIAGIGGAGDSPQVQPIIVFGNDQITVGNGNNHIFGDADMFNTISLGPDNMLTTGAVGNGVLQGSLSFGNDLISAGNGSNVVYGDVNQVIENMVSGDHAASGSTAYIERDEFTFSFGSDTINVGNGGNMVFGDVGTYLIHLQSGDYLHGGVANSDESIGFDPATSSNAGLFTGSNTTFGVDHINSGSGNDTLIGDVGTFTIDIHGGQHMDGSTGPATASAGLGPYNDLVDQPFASLGADVAPVTFGKDEIHGGGGDDHIYGEGISLNTSAIAGSIDTPYTGDPIFINPNTGDILPAGAAILDVRAVIGSGSPVTAGDDKLYGDAGNDVIYGDWQTLNITLQDGKGTGLSTIPELTNASIDTLKMGDDLLVGGAGNDVLYGDLATLNFQHLDANGNLITDNIMDPNSNVAHFIEGNNTLFGGAGNDTLYGDQFGTGHNQYVYDGSINNGTDTIANFSVQNDTLVGQRGATFSDGGHNGAGDLVVVVHDIAGATSMITLLGDHGLFSALHTAQAAMPVA